MPDPKGFMKYTHRETPQRRPVPLRLLDWKEVYEDFSHDALREQATRCMDCGIPFCHNGCPLGNLIPEWNDLVRADRWRDAIERLHATNNFPEFTGRLCPAPCEGSCVLGINQDPVTIKQVEVEIIDNAFGEGWVVPLPPDRLTGKTVAVVGSGPAGLAAAQQLTRAGHVVTVFERDDRIGGLLRYGIPEFKMEKRHIDRRLAQMEAEGTRFLAGVNVGIDITAHHLRSEFDAVVLAGGATAWRDLPIPGRELDGILTYIDKLRALDTTGVEPTSHAVPVTNVMRDDVPCPSLPQADALEQRRGAAQRFNLVAFDVELEQRPVVVLDHHAEPVAIQLPIGPAVAVAVEEKNFLAFDDEKIPILTRQFSAWVPDPDGTTIGCIPAWVYWGYDCSSGLIVSDLTEVQSNASALGVNGGVGLTFRVGEAPYRMYVESRYHFAPTKNITTQMLIVSWGIRY